MKTYRKNVIISALMLVVLGCALGASWFAFPKKCCYKHTNTPNIVECECRFFCIDPWILGPPPEPLKCLSDPGSTCCNQ